MNNDSPQRSAQDTENSNNNNNLTRTILVMKITNIPNIEETVSEITFDFTFSYIQKVDTA